MPRRRAEPAGGCPGCAGCSPSGWHSICDTTPEAFAKRLAEGGFLILVHDNADVDAVASAAALFFAYPGCAIAAPGGLSRQGRMLARRLGVEVAEGALLALPPKVVVVDAAGPEMVSAELPAGTMVIDHHRGEEAWKGFAYLSDTSKPSCSEVVLALLGGRLTAEAARALTYGILADSGGFRHATPATFRDFAVALESGGEAAEDIFAFFNEVPDDISQRIARIKAAQRVRFAQAGEHIVACTQIGAHEADVCRMLLVVGCDVAFAGRQDGADFRASGRARPGIGVSLAELMSAVAAEFGGTGGGHDCAAGMAGSGDIEAALNACVSRTVDILKCIKKE